MLKDGPPATKYVSSGNGARSQVSWLPSIVALRSPRAKVGVGRERGREREECSRGRF